MGWNWRGSPPWLQLRATTAAGNVRNAWKCVKTRPHPASCPNPKMINNRNSWALLSSAPELQPAIQSPDPSCRTAPLECTRWPRWRQGYHEALGVPAGYHPDLPNRINPSPSRHRLAFFCCEPSVTGESRCSQRTWKITQGSRQEPLASVKPHKITRSFRIGAAMQSRGPTKICSTVYFPDENDHLVCS